MFSGPSINGLVFRVRMVLRSYCFHAIRLLHEICVIIGSATALSVLVLEIAKRWKAPKSFRIKMYQLSASSSFWEGLVLSVTEPYALSSIYYNEKARLCGTLTQCKPHNRIKPRITANLKKMQWKLRPIFSPQKHREMFLLKFCSHLCRGFCL